MPHRLQLRPHLFASALHSHLEGRLACPREGCDLRVLEPLAMLEQKRFAELRLPLAERGGESVPPLESRRRRGRPLVRALVHHVLVCDHVAVSGAPASQRSAPVDQNPEQPRTKGFTLDVSSERSIRAKERFL